MIRQRSVIEVEIQGKKLELYCDNDTPLGVLHDGLMQMKGWCVTRMINTQKEELEASKSMKEID